MIANIENRLPFQTSVAGLHMTANTKTTNGCLYVGNQSRKWFPVCPLISTVLDGWCYSFNVIDCFTRKWVAYVFDTNATRHVAVDSITKAVAAEKPDCSKLRLRTDNGNQYTSHDFRQTVKALGI